MDILVWVVVVAAVGFVGWKVVKSGDKKGSPADGLAQRNVKKPAQKEK